ncbi:MAG: hypothetical protein MJ229_05735 [bacterium]|nr:hypothetical protein [bacterium]
MFNFNIEKIKEKLYNQGITNEQECENKAKEILNSVYEIAENANNEKEEKRIAYELAKAENANAAEKMTSLEKQLATNPNSKRDYYEAVSVFEDSEIMVKIKRSSYSDANRYAGKMNIAASMANYLG